MANTNTNSSWGHYFIGQGVNFDDYNIKDYPLNNNVLGTGTNKKWVQSLTNRDGSTIFDYPYMYIICTFDRGNNEFINASRRLFTLKLLSGVTSSTSHLIYNKETTNEKNIWYKEFDQGNIAVVFKIKREKIPSYFNGFYVCVENTESGGDSDYRRSEKTYIFSINKSRTELYFTSGFLDYDIVIGQEANYFNNRINKILRYGTNVQLYGLEASGKNNYNYHNGEIKITYDDTRYGSEENLSINSFKVYYDDGTTSEGLSNLSTEKTIINIAAKLSTEEEADLNISNIPQHWRTIGKKWIPKNNNFFRDIKKITRDEITLSSSIKEELILDSDFPLDNMKCYLIDVNKNKLSEKTFTKNRCYLNYDEEIFINSKTNLTNLSSIKKNEYFLILEGTNRFDQLSTSIEFEETIKLTNNSEYNYIAIDVIPKIVDAEDYEVLGNIIFTDEYLTFNNEKVTIIDRINLTSISIDWENNFHGFYGLLEDKREQKFYWNDIYSSEERHEWYNTDSDLKKYSYNILRNPPHSLDYSDDKLTKFIYIAPNLIYEGNKVISNVEEFQLCRATQLKVKNNSVVLKGTVLSYYLEDNGSDKNDLYTANSFVQGRLDTSPVYFGYSRQGTVSKPVCETLKFILTNLDNNEEAVGILPIPDFILSSILENFKIGSTKKIDFSALNIEGIFNNILNFINNNTGSSNIELKLSLWYTYPNTTKSKELFTFSIDGIEIAGGEPSFGIRKRGIIVNPKTDNNDIEDGYAQKINIEANEVDGKDTAIPLEINVYKEGSKIDSCTIEYKDESFYFDGVDVSKLKEQSDTNKTSIDTLNTNIGDENSGLKKQIKDNITNITNLQNGFSLINAFVTEEIQVNKGTDGDYEDGDAYDSSATITDNRITSNSICFPIIRPIGTNGEIRNIGITCYITSLTVQNGQCQVGYITGCPAITIGTRKWKVGIKLFVINLPTPVATNISETEEI